MKPRNFVRLEFPSFPANVGLARIAIATFATQLEFTLGNRRFVGGFRGRPNCVICVIQFGARELEVHRRWVLEIGITDYGIIDDIALARTAFSTDPERMGLGLVYGAVHGFAGSPAGARRGHNRPQCREERDGPRRV